MDLPYMNEAWLWFAAGLVFAVAEIFLPSFFLIFAAIATVTPIGCALLGYGFATQLIGFGLSLLASIFLLRPLFLEKYKNTKSIPSRTDRLLGATGSVSQTINPDLGPGRVTVMGEDWAAISPMTIQVGQAVKIVGVDGVVLSVKPLN